MKKIVIIVPMYDELDHELFDVKIEDKKIVGSFYLFILKISNGAGNHRRPKNLTEGGVTRFLH